MKKDRKEELRVALWLKAMKRTFKGIVHDSVRKEYLSRARD